jgi:thioredoxin-related protein
MRGRTGASNRLPVSDCGSPSFPLHCGVHLTILAGLASGHERTRLRAACDKFRRKRNFASIKIEWVRNCGVVPLRLHSSLYERRGGIAMLSRRALMMSGGSFALAARPAAAAVMTDDGFYREDWFLDSFLELADDLKSAAVAGKLLAVIWEQAGCPYCRDTHLINFAQKSVADYIRNHFELIELDLHGSRVVTDFDGEKLGERQLAAKYGVRGTPTIQFFPDLDDLGRKRPREREVNRILGYLAPKDFLRMFAFVAERAYERGSLRDYLRRRPSLPSRVGEEG